MKYASRPVEVEAMHWAPPGSYRMADSIVTWVNANGGEARYEADTWEGSGELYNRPRIAVRTVNGWAYAGPGDYIVAGEWFYNGDGWEDDEPAQTRDFHPVNSASFESRWEPSVIGEQQ